MTVEKWQFDYEVVKRLVRKNYGKLYITEDYTGRKAHIADVYGMEFEMVCKTFCIEANAFNAAMRAVKMTLGYFTNRGTQQTPEENLKAYTVLIGVIQDAMEKLGVEEEYRELAKKEFLAKKAGINEPDITGVEEKPE